MVNWIAGNWPDGFRCLVNHDGVFDNRMMYYATEELWFPEWEHGGPYWAHPEGYEEHNPVLFVDRWKTPMLVVHGALDFRVPDDSGDRRLHRRCSAAGSPAGSSSSPTRTTGCSSRRTASSGTRRCSTGSIGGCARTGPRATKECKNLHTSLTKKERFKDRTPTL